MCSESASRLHAWAAYRQCRVCVSIVTWEKARRRLCRTIVNPFASRQWTARLLEDAVCSAGSHAAAYIYILRQSGHLRLANSLSGPKTRIAD